MTPRPFLGVVTGEIPPVVSAQLGLPEGFGLLVQTVLPDSPAKAAGVEEHDILKLFNDQQLIEPGQLATLVRAAGKDAQATLTVIRKGQEQKLNVTIGERALPEPRPFMEMHRRMHDFGGSVREHARDLQEEAREQQRRTRRSFHELRERMRDRQDTPQADPIPPKDILKEAKPGGGANIKFFNENRVSSVDGSKARLILKDQDGEVEVAAEDGNRVLTAKDAKGETVFHGPINTPEQLQGVPQQFREKLERIQVRQSDAGRTLGFALGGEDDESAPDIQ